MNTSAYAVRWVMNAMLHAGFYVDNYDLWAGSRASRDRGNFLYNLSNMKRAWSIYWRRAPVV